MGFLNWKTSGGGLGALIANQLQGKMGGNLQDPNMMGNAVKAITASLGPGMAGLAGGQSPEMGMIPKAMPMVQPNIDLGGFTEDGQRNTMTPGFGAAMFPGGGAWGGFAPKVGAAAGGATGFGRGTVMGPASMMKRAPTMMDFMSKYLGGSGYGL